MIFFTILVIAISVSMDAFSLSLLYGTLNLKTSQIIKLSIMVGVFHFFMPLLGLLSGSYLIDILHMPAHLVMSIIFIFIGIEMINSSFIKEEKLILLDFKGLLLFAFTVSIDSFSIGAGLKAFSDNYLMCSSVFFFTSLLFTYLGLNIGKTINKKLGFISTIIGGSILIVIGILYGIII